MAQMIIDGLRPQIGRSAGLGPQDTGNDGDVEEDYPGPTARRSRAPKIRHPSENMLSVSFSPLLLANRLTPRLGEDPPVYAQTHQRRQIDAEYSHRTRIEFVRPQPWPML